MTNIYRSLYQEDRKYFTSCPFCDWPAQKPDLIIERTDHYFLTVNEYPYTEHHLLIAPFAHLTDFVNEPVSTEKEYLTKKAARILKVLGLENYLVLDRDGPNSGRSLVHLHRHLIPVQKPEDVIYDHKEIRSDWTAAEAAEIAKKALQKSSHPVPSAKMAS